MCQPATSMVSSCRLSGAFAYQGCCSGLVFAVRCGCGLVTVLRLRTCAEASFDTSAEALSSPRPAPIHRVHWESGWPGAAGLLSLLQIERMCQPATSRVSSCRLSGAFAYQGCCSGLVFCCAVWVRAGDCAAATHLRRSKLRHRC